MDDRSESSPRKDASAPSPERPAPGSRWRLIAGGVIGLLLIGAVIWWIASRPVEQPAGGRGGAGGPMAVVAATVVKGDLDIALNALGTVTSLSTVTVRSQISGQLVKIDFVEGEDVKTGDPLAEIDSRPYELALQQAQGQLMRDQALLSDAQLDLDRYKSLIATNALPKQQYDTQASLVQQLRGTVVSDQAQIDTAKLNIAYCHIVAPGSGRVGLRQVDQGNYVTPTDTNGIVLLTLLQPITVIFTLPEDNLPAVRGRIQAGATLSTTAYDRSATTQLAVGTLMTIDNQIDTTTGTAKLRAQFANEAANLFPNQFVNIKLLVDVLHDATVVPASAVQRGSPGTYVYLVNPDDTVSTRVIELGPADGERQSVRSGLSPGDRVVVDGADKLRDGAKVVLRDSAAAPAPPTTGAQPSAAPGAQPGGSQAPPGTPNRQ
jgi:multidrug efflux system membrane fusion protein